MSPQAWAALAFIVPILLLLVAVGLLTVGILKGLERWEAALTRRQARLAAADEPRMRRLDKWT